MPPYGTTIAICMCPRLDVLGELLLMYVVCRRVELVLVHEEGGGPSGTAAWLAARPHLARHHHIRLSHPKVPFSPLAAASAWPVAAVPHPLLGMLGDGSCATCSSPSDMGPSSAHDTLHQPSICRVGHACVTNQGVVPLLPGAWT